MPCCSPSAGIVRGLPLVSSCCGCLDQLPLSQAEADVEHAGGGDEVRKRPRLVDVEEVGRVVPAYMCQRFLPSAKRASTLVYSQEHLSNHMQTQQVDKTLITRCHSLRQRSRQSETREHLHQVVMRRVQPQRQPRQVRHLLPRLLIIPPLLIARIQTRRRARSREGVRDGHVERAERGDLARLRDARGAAGGAEPDDRVGDAVDGFLEHAVGGADPGGEGDGGEEEGAEAGGGEAFGVDAVVFVSAGHVPMRDGVGEYVHAILPQALDEAVLGLDGLVARSLCSLLRVLLSLLGLHFGFSTDLTALGGERVFGLNGALAGLVGGIAGVFASLAALLVGSVLVARHLDDLR